MVPTPTEQMGQWLGPMGLGDPHPSTQVEVENLKFSKATVGHAQQVMPCWGIELAASHQPGMCP